MSAKVPMTPEGHKKMKDRLKHLKSVERPKNIHAIEVARAHGDISENAEFEAAKEEQAHLNREIRELEDKLARAQIIDPTKLDHAQIAFGATVKLLDMETEIEVTYQIVGSDESDIQKGKISIESPIARALIGKTIGDAVMVRAPKGTKEYEILIVTYQ